MVRGLKESFGAWLRESFWCSRISSVREGVSKVKLVVSCLNSTADMYCW